jgi:PKD repeat protein
MRHLFSLALVSSFVLITVTSCKKKEVVPSFDVNQSKTVDEDFQFSFTNSTENATKYEWDFGDGNTSSETNPKHVYSKKGDFTVQLTATNDDGDFEVTEKVVTVGDWTLNNLTADFSGINWSNITPSDTNSTCSSFSHSDISVIGFFDIPFTSPPITSSQIFSTDYGQWTKDAIPFSLRAYLLNCYGPSGSTTSLNFKNSTNYMNINGEDVEGINGRFSREDLYPGTTNVINTVFKLEENDDIILIGDPGELSINMEFDIKYFD